MPRRCLKRRRSSVHGIFPALLEGMVAEETRPVDRLPHAQRGEREQVLYGWNATKAEYPGDEVRA